MRTLVLRSSISSTGEEEERSELSEGLKDGELLSPCSTDRELGLSSRACAAERHAQVSCSISTYSEESEFSLLFL